jgi:Lrp/AsnC family transcriptional regulator, leucine-responsive regulatory protein
MIENEIDRAILRVLQSDGKLSNVLLANKVGLSESACLRRVKNLEASGVIDRYVMLVDAAAVGRPGIVFVQVTLDSQQQESLRAYEKAITGVPEVMECYLMSGDQDYMLRVVVKDPLDYEHIHMQLTRLPGVSRVKSSFGLRTILKKTQIPLNDSKCG